MNPMAARVFLTGEAREDFLGSEVDMLYKANDLIPEPLFIQTKDMTVRMARFRPEEVWRCFSPELLIGLCRDECIRFGLEDLELEEFDFYKSLIRYLRDRKDGKPCIPVPFKEDAETCYQVLYFGALYLFDKPGYMAVPVEKHFCRRETEEFLKTIRFRELNDDEAAEWNEIQDAGMMKDALTNQEIEFLVSLHDRDLGRR
jgi:hypothetical protein